jgi:hypothetical protein
LAGGENFGQKTYQVIGVWRKLRSMEFHNLYTSPNIITMIKLKRFMWTGGDKGEKLNASNILV